MGQLCSHSCILVWCRLHLSDSLGRKGVGIILIALDVIDNISMRLMLLWLNTLRKSSRIKDLK